MPSLPGFASAPPLDDDLYTAPVPRMPRSATGDHGRCIPGLGDEEEPPPLEVTAELALESPVAPSPAWEQKLVAVLAIELTFPTAAEVEAAMHEPWTAASRWEQTLVAKVQGFGGVVLQRSPSLLLVAFGMPQTLEQMPQRAVQAALALRHLVAEGTEGEPCPELRVAVHWGPLLVDVQASDPTGSSAPLGRRWPGRCAC